MGLHVVTGPPAAGKSTFVRDHAQSGDIRIDFDDLANTLAGLPPGNHEHSPATKAITKAARAAAVTAALKHADTVDVWVIHSTPSRDTLDGYRRDGAEIHVVDPGRELVMNRIKKTRPSFMHAVAARWYEEHGVTTKRRKPTTTEKGLGWQHQKQRERLLRMHRDGDGCWWCGEPMYRSQSLDADHEDARVNGGSVASRLLHASCNRSRKDGARDEQRPAVAGAPQRRPSRAVLLDWGD